jgi:hypothetical protein
MPTITYDRPVIERDEVATATVEEVITTGAEQTATAAEAILKLWEAAEWPAGLVALSLFTGTDDGSILVYAQWSSEAAAAEFGLSSTIRPDWWALGIEPGDPRPYQLYRRVRPTTLPDPLPLPECYPAARFAMDGAQTAREWIDGLLSNEEENEGEDRAYPGALAANFHVGADGVFLLSEWASESEVIEHIAEVIIPLLEYMGQAEAGPGRRYRFHAAVTAT